MAGLGLQGAYGLSGMMDALDQILLQRAEAEERQRRADAEANDRAQQQQEFGFRQSRAGEDDRRYAQERTDRQEAATTKTAEATAKKAAFEAFLTSVPNPSKRAMLMLQREFGITGADEHVQHTEAQEQQEQETAAGAKLSGFTEQEKIRTGNEAGLIRLRGSEQRQTDAATPRSAGGLSPGQTANFTRGLQKDWRAVSVNARELDRQVKNISVGLEAARAGNLAQGAQTLLVTFQKILDPISVVRESEYMRSAAGQSLVNQAVGALERAVSGGAGVPLPELEKYAQVALKIAQSAPMSLERERGRIAATAEQYGINPKLVVDDPFVPETSQGGDPQVGPPPGAQIKTFPNGKRAWHDGTGWVMIP